MSPDRFEPRIVAFFCNWCTYTAADLAGVSRMQYAHNIRIIRVMCSGRVDPQFILEAFVRGADGVLVGGCHPGDCHYIEGNYLARRKIYLVKELLEFVGVEPERFRMSWVSAAEGAKYAQVVKDFVEDLRPLGPQDKLKAQRS